MGVTSGRRAWGACPRVCTLRCNFVCIYFLVSLLQTSVCVAYSSWAFQVSHL